MPRRRARSSLARSIRPLISVGVLAFGLVLSGAFVGIAVRQNAVQQEGRAAQQQIDAELARQAQLRAQIAERKTDTYVIDKARELGYVRPGEGLIAVERGPSGEPVVRINASDGGRLGRWLAVFFGTR
ncbi:MAG: septum formation initiator family protein [Chloroflexi bacterium]|nr:septum formation initiator family protein [Chloroflexota bacterium]MBI2983909.1 septum formation initiator family protein [Chloroflexota bacterium]